jgi:23S rRNA pseudouridine2605 synthase
MSRRKAHEAVAHGRVAINGVMAKLTDVTDENDRIELDDIHLKKDKLKTIILNKPVGYVCSRDGQGSKTVYHLLPENLHNLKPVGRLDKDSSGLILLTNDGELANKLTHPSEEKEKVYRLTLDKKLLEADKDRIEEGIVLDDGASRLMLEGHELEWIVRMHEGRNRQIRRTFDALGYEVEKLHRIGFGPYHLGSLPKGEFETVS